MKHSASILETRPALIFLSPRERAVPRRLYVTLWQTHSWTKKIIKVGERNAAALTARGRGPTLTARWRETGGRLWRFPIERPPLAQYSLFDL
jgi:hypothetical protein